MADLRYSFILLPLLFVSLPFIITGNIIIFSIGILTTFILSAVTLILIANLNIGGSGQVLATGVSGKLSLNTEAGYQLFVVIFAGLFFGIGSAFTLISGFFTLVINAIHSLFVFIPALPTTPVAAGNFNALNVNIVGIGNVYPMGLTMYGLSVFGCLYGLMAILYMMGIYFFISSRGH